jgi:hypothetical protein
VSEEKKREMVRKILAWLYEDWVHNQERGLGTLRREEQWDKSDFDSVLARLRELALIEEGELTPDGVKYVEDNLIVPKSEVAKHDELRTKALEFLNDLYQTDGSGAFASVEQIAQGCGLNMSDMFVDLRLLKRWGYLENIGSTSYRVTDSGRRYYLGADYQDII